jgi:adenosylcobinamide-GDP ribazoletransferase
MGGLTTDLRTGLAFCTRLPIAAADGPNLTQAVWTFPLVGALIGALGALVYWLTASLGSFVAATLAVTATTLVTGALHEDGLADTADGLGGGTTKERKLEIMRDSRSGAYGVTALILSYLLRVSAIASLTAAGSVAAALIAAHAGARAAMALFMATVPQARKEGLSAAAGTPKSGPVAVAAMLGLLALLLCLGIGTGLLAVLLVTIVVAGAAHVARRHIGGQTGDVIGAVEQASEIVILLTAAAFL